MVRLKSCGQSAHGIARRTPLHARAVSNGGSENPHGRRDTVLPFPPRRSVPAALSRDRLLRLVAKAKLHTDLVMADTTIADVSLDLGDLEPLEIPEGFRSRFDTVLDGILNTGFRCADDLGDAVNMIAHLRYPATVGVRGEFQPGVCGGVPDGSLQISPPASTRSISGF